MKLCVTRFSSSLTTLLSNTNLKVSHYYVYLFIFHIQQKKTKRADGWSEGERRDGGRGGELNGGERKEAEMTVFLFIQSFPLIKTSSSRNNSTHVLISIKLVTFIFPQLLLNNIQSR